MEFKFRNVSILSFGIPISIIMYLLCLFFPAYYFWETREPQYSIAILATGWLGLLVGQFAWYANPLYFLSLIFIRRTASAFLLPVSLVLALSFLTTKEMEVGGGSKAEISSYGLGYYFWINSIIVLFLTWLSHCFRLKIKTFLIISITIFIFITIIFLNHYYLSDNSQMKFVSQKEKLFDSACKKSHSKIFSTRNSVRSVYFESVYGAQYEKRGGGWYPDNYGIYYPGIKLSYYETLNDMHRLDKAKNKYVKIDAADDRRSEGEPRDEISSDYSVLMKNLDFPKKFQIVGKTITIVDNKTGEVLAVSSYTFEPITAQLCSDLIVGNRFDDSSFVRQVLSASK